MGDSHTDHVHIHWGRLFDAHPHQRYRVVLCHTAYDMTTVAWDFRCHDLLEAIDRADRWLRLVRHTSGPMPYVYDTWEVYARETDGSWSNEPIATGVNHCP